MYFICMDLFSMFVPPFCGCSMCMDTISAVYLYSKPPPLFDSPYQTMWSCILCTGLVWYLRGVRGVTQCTVVCVYVCVEQCSQCWQLIDFSPILSIQSYGGKYGWSGRFGAKVITNDVLTEVKIRTQS